MSKSDEANSDVGASVFKYVVAPLLVAVLTAVILNWIGEGDDGSMQNASSGNRPGKVRPVEEVDHTVQLVGGFVVTIRSLQCGAEDFGIYEARGEFCVLRVKVENRGKTATSVTRSWTMYVGEKEYPATSAAGPGFDSLFPDESAEGAIAFDVQVGNDPTKVRIGFYSDSPTAPL